MSTFEKIGQQEIEELYNKYAKSWGRINFEAFKELMFHKYQIQGEDNVRLLRFIFEALDGEGFFNFDDGHLNLDEFKKMMSFFPKEMQSQHMTLVIILFNVLDKNHDRTIDRRELLYFLRKLRKQCAELVSKEILFNYDENQDGVMDFNEFVEFLKSNSF